MKLDLEELRARIFKLLENQDILLENPIAVEKLIEVVSKEAFHQGDADSALAAFCNGNACGAYSDEDFIFIRGDGEYGEQNTYYYEGVFNIQGTLWKYTWEDCSYGGPDFDYATLKPVKLVTKTIEVYE